MWRNMPATRALLILSLLAGACGSPARASRASAPAGPVETRDIVYSTTDGVASSLDLYRSAAPGPAPVLVYFHGGSWTTGARPRAASSFRGFLDLGFSVVSVDYRLSGVAPAPAAVQDARCAMAWVKANAERFGFDTTRVVAYGTSAGGQLALMTTMLPAPWADELPRCHNLPRVAAVLDYYGPVDVGEFAAKSANTRKWLGQGEAAAEMARAMSPLRYVRPGLPPVMIIHGDADPTVPHEQSVRLRDALSAAGVPVEMYSVPGGLHGNFSDSEKLRVMERTAAFLRARGIVPPAP
jgi:acetyl esterase/lipase